MRSLFLAARRSRPAKIRAEGIRMSGPRKKRGPAKTALQAVELQLKYHAVTFLQRRLKDHFGFSSSTAGDSWIELQTKRARNDRL